MSLTLSLNNALAGLNINQQSLASLSQNIANANTKGYTRKIISQSSVYLDGRGAGVSLAGINRRVDEYLIRTIRAQGSVTGRAQGNADYADRTQLFLGSPGSTATLNATTTRFFGSLQTLAQTPEDATAKNSAINTAVSLTSSISQLANNLQELRFEADQEIQGVVTVINSDLRQIFDLNTNIARNSLAGKPVGELLDKRDDLVADLSQYLDIQTFTREDGSINISSSRTSLLDETLYVLDYSPVSSAAAIANNPTFDSIKVYRTNRSGNIVGDPEELVSGGRGSDVTTTFTSGRIKALIEQRDTVLPNLLAQLDSYAASLRDRFNAVHNSGIGFPGANSYTGARRLVADSFSQWSGSVRIGVLDGNGKPVGSPYVTQPGGVPPLTLDLASLDTGAGAGRPSLQGIVDEINRYYAPPDNKVSLGNLTNIRLASNVNTLPGSPPRFNFDLDLENLSAGSASVFVTGIRVTNNVGADVTSITQNAPSIAIAGTNSFETTNGSSTVIVRTAAPHGLANGQTVYLPDLAATILPATDINGIPVSSLAGYFTITNVTDTSFEIAAPSAATADGAVNATGASFFPPYAGIEAGQTRRTTADGALEVSLGLDDDSPFYTVQLNVGVLDENGALKTSQITYRVDNSVSNIRNNRYAVRTTSGDAQIITPTSRPTLARAILVDENGTELPKTNGRYNLNRTGFLKIVAENSSNVVAIDSLDSAEEGRPDDTPPTAATGRGFSYYFGLNNFFNEGDGSESDTVTGSAAGLSVMQRLINDPNLISTGRLNPTPGSNDPNRPPSYTYERGIGDSSVIQALSALGLTNIAFPAAGGLASTSQTFSGYASQIIGNAAVSASTAKSDAKSAQTTLEAFEQQNSSISGVNLDEELANTVIYQNAYAASARIITVTATLFDSLIQAV